MKTLYEILGTKPDASQAEIKAAFRSLAQKHHPDREGGSIEAFQEINAAYEVLSDEVRRKRYDKTGSTSEGPSLDTVATSVITEIFASIIENESFYGDIIVEAKKSVTEDLSRIKAFVKAQNKKLVKLTKLCNRVKASGENLFAMVLESKLKNIADGIADAEFKASVLDKAFELLATHNDESPTKPEIAMHKFNQGFINESMFEELIKRGRF